MVPAKSFEMLVAWQLQGVVASLLMQQLKSKKLAKSPWGTVNVQWQGRRVKVKKEMWLLPRPSESSALWMVIGRKASPVNSEPHELGADLN